MLLCFITSLKAQESINCDFNLREAIFYLKGDSNFKRDTLKSIQYLKPCINKGDARANIVLSRIYASQNDPNKNKEAFKILKDLVKEDNAIAMGDLGVLYKYGIGCRLNYNKARKWFKKAAELGNDKSAYSLGYLYLKGFGNIEQNYIKAVQWFKKSDYPMATYWLGVCYYYGYGVSQNIEKANQLLGTNLKRGFSMNQSTTNTNTSANQFSEPLATENDASNETLATTEQNLYGQWTGKLLKFDWSSKNIEQKHDFTLEIKYDSIKEQAVYTLQINDQKPEEKTINRIDDEIYFDELHIKLPHKAFNENIPNNLDYQFLSSKLSLKSIGEFTFLTGTIENYINSWNESGAPLKFVLQKKETFANSEQELSDEVLNALSSQEDTFIKLYPNPFKRDLIISYTLETPSNVVVKVTDINATKEFVVEKGKQQKAGKHRYFFNGTHLKKGLYVVTVLANNLRKTRIIVKK